MPGSPYADFCVFSLGRKCTVFIPASRHVVTLQIYPLAYRHLGGGALKRCIYHVAPCTNYSIATTISVKSFQVGVIKLKPACRLADTFVSPFLRSICFCIYFSSLSTHGLTSEFFLHSPLLSGCLTFFHPPCLPAANPWLSRSPLDLRLFAGLRTLSWGFCLQIFSLLFVWKQIFFKVFSVFLSWWR